MVVGKTMSSLVHLSKNVLKSKRKICLTTDLIISMCVSKREFMNLLFQMSNEHLSLMSMYITVSRKSELQ